MSAAGEVVRGDIQAQTRAACERMPKAWRLRRTLDQVVKATVWLSDMGHFAGFNEVYKEFFGAALPVRSTVASALALGVDVEIEVQAFVGEVTAAVAAVREQGGLHQ
jgi:enamine deaminase RidA (YjgF/YER057c/UK114 family)